MATISEINQTSSYAGNAALGGGVAIGVPIDTSPLQRLATFAFYRDRDLFEQKQKQDAEAAKSIAQITAFDVTSPLAPYRDTLKTQLDEIQKFVRENPDAHVYGRNPQKHQELNEKINKFHNLRSSATASDAIYNARKAAIDREPDSQKRKVLQDELDLDVKEHFSAGIDNVLGTPLKSAAEIKPDDYQIPQAKVTSFDVISEGANKDVTSKFKFVNLDQLRAESELLASGIGAPALDENTAWFKSLSPERQNIERQKASITSTKRQQLAKISQDFNSLLDQFQQANPGVDITAIKGDVTGRDTLMDNIKAANNFNSQIQELNQLIGAGKLKDPTGKVLTRKFDMINLKDGLSESEVIMMNALQQSKTPILQEVDKQITNTDNAIQQQQLYETARHNKATEAMNKEELGLRKEQWNAGMKGGETVKNGAMERAQRIYNSLRNLADENGVIPPEKIRQLNTEQLKYLGTETVGTDADGNPTKPVYTPLALDKKTAIQLMNGEIRVLNNAEKLPDGRYHGLWDRTKSTTIFNAATNILNEQLSKAGAKELNAYLPIDLGTGGVSTNSVGGSSTQSSSTTQQQTVSQPDPGGYTIAELRGWGWSEEQIAEAVRQKKIKLK